MERRHRVPSRREMDLEKISTVARSRGVHATRLLLIFATADGGGQSAERKLPPRIALREMMKIC